MSTAFWRDDRLPYIIESRQASDSRICYKPHSHPTYSIGVVDAGQSIFSSQSCGQHHLKAGNLILIPAHQEHSCNPLPDLAWSYQMLHLDLNWLTTSHTEIQSSQKHELNRVIVFEIPELYQTFCKLNDLLFSDAEVFIKEVELHHLIDQLFTISPNPTYLTEHQQTNIPSIEHCIDQIDLNKGLLSLNSLAAMTGLSHFQIIRKFKASTGFTPHYFQLNLRINHARELLLQQHALSTIAYQLGFSDQSHFQRTFKSFVGITPQQYQKASSN